MQVPFVSLKSTHDKLSKVLLEKYSALVDKGDFILGEEVGAFEREYARFSQTKYCIGVSNGLDALKISLRALGIGSGDEVIVPAHTYIASIFAVLEVGATPILIDPDRETYNITAATISPAITERTRAIMPVHLYGQPCDMDDIQKLASTHSLKTIEDNAQAQGASYKGKKTGSFGHVNATSFYPSKNLGAMGDAGAVTTDDKSLYQIAQALRNVGSKAKYHHELIGYNARLDTLQAGVLNIKLPYLMEWNDQRREVAGRYLKNLKDCASIVLPKTIADAEHVYHLFVIRHREREKLQQYLHQQGIQTLIHYPVATHLQSALRHLGYKTGDLPVTEEIAETCLSLPIFPGLSDEQIDFVSEKIIAFDKQFFRKLW
jgi:dTDP-4-amino-4,6-dideoxygalactose transaminase